MNLNRAYFAVLVAASSTQAATFDWATVGNPGNSPNPDVNVTTPSGSVDYIYLLSVTEVTNSHYAEFLNAVAQSDPNELYNTNMATSSSGGILQSGSPGSFSYTVKQDFGTKPVNFVSYFDAMRFVNWLENGQGTGGTESGAYTIANGLTESRNANAQYVLPSRDEWYKAAYHNSADGIGDDYFRFATQSNTAPSQSTASPSGDVANPGANVANFGNGAIWNGGSNVVSVASAGVLSQSSYGTFDQAGNVWEWTEETFDLTTRIIRGGGFTSNPGTLASDFVTGISPGTEGPNYGFRVAYVVPEPTAMSCVVVALGLLGSRRQR